MKKLLNNLKNNAMHQKINIIVFFLITICIQLALSGSLWSQSIPEVTVRFANAQYECNTARYCLDVEFQASEDDRQLAGMNIRFVYDSYVLQFMAVDQFAAGYGLSKAPSVTVGNESSGSGYFWFKGPMTYWNGTMHLVNPYAEPVYLETAGWTKLFRLCFQVIDSEAFADNAFSPSIAWEKQQNPEEGGFFGGSDGVVITLVDPDDVAFSQPSTEYVIHHNWTYNEEPCISFGHPVAVDVFSLPPANCNTSDMMIAFDAPPVPLGGATPEGGIYTGTGVSGNSFYPAVAGVGVHTVKYTYINADSCPMICTFHITVYDVPRISGQVIYFNDESTPLNQVTLRLKNASGNVVATTVSADYQVIASDTASVIPGFFAFPNIPDGEYTIEAVTDLPWFGANSTDALLVQYRAVNAVPAGILWHPILSESASDVNKSNTVTSLDALFIMRRSVGLIGQFPAGNWIFTNPSFTLSGQQTVEVKALNSGDLNRSNVPYGMKSAPSVFLAAQGDMPVLKNEEVILPVTMSSDIELGAVTLILKYRNDLVEVLDADMEVKNINHKNGTLALAWASTDSHRLKTNDIITTLKVRILHEIPDGTMIFYLEDGSELADNQATVLRNVVINIPALTTETSALAELELSNQPNPFTEFTRITYRLPVEGHATIVVYDQLGRELKVLFRGLRPAGEHHVEFRHPSLGAGVYLYRLFFEENGNLHSKSKSMIFMH